MVDWAARLDDLYNRDPEAYLELTKQPCRARNPLLMQHALSVLTPFMGPGAWPMFIWTMAQQYTAGGGIAKWPGSAGLEDAVYKDVAQRTNDSGPIGSVVTNLHDRMDEAFRFFGTGEGVAVLRAEYGGILSANPRLEPVLEVDDVVQEALSLGQAFRAKPWIVWDIGEELDPSDSGAMQYIARVGLARMLQKRFHSNTKIARKTRYLNTYETDHSGGDDPIFEELETKEWNEAAVSKLREVLDSLPPKQRQAVEINYRAIQDTVSLEEQARREAVDPSKVRENFKAAQRRFRP